MKTVPSQDIVNRRGAAARELLVSYVAYLVVFHDTSVLDVEDNPEGVEVFGDEPSTRSLAKFHEAMLFPFANALIQKDALELTEEQVNDMEFMQPWVEERVDSSLAEAQGHVTRVLEELGIPADFPVNNRYVANEATQLREFAAGLGLPPEFVEEILSGM